MSQAFSVGSVVLPVTFALLNLGNMQTPIIAQWALAGVLTFYITLLRFGVLASRKRVIEFRPHIPTLKQHSQTYVGTTLERWVADEYERSIRANSELLGTKGLWVGVATYSLYLEALSLSVAAIATLLF